MTSAISRAIQWAEAGYWVYPVRLTIDEHGKKAVDFPGNWRESVNDPGAVRALFSEWPSHDGVAVDTGKSGVVVIDLDITGTKDGIRNLTEAGIPLPPTAMRAVTWSGGMHGFYRQPERRVGSGQNKPVRDVDFRGDGGVVFVDPTRVYSADGSEVLGTYAVKGPILVVGELPILPESYASRLRSEPAAVKPEPAKRAVRPTTLRDDQRTLLERFVDDDLAVIRNAVSGSRNEALGRTLFLADRYQKLGYGFEEFLADVLGAYDDSGGTDYEQARNWCSSSWGRVTQDPMSVPRTEVDDMADQYHQRLVAQRLARAKVSGSSARLVDESSFVDWTADPVPPEFWVSGVLPKGEQVVLYGRPEAGKTFTALGWALSVSTGSDWFGRRTTAGRVWYMSGEGNTRITSRVHAWVRHSGVKPDTGQFRLLNHVPDLMNDTVIDQVARRIAEDEVDVGFIDTLGRAMSIGGGDISSPPDAAQALRSLQVLSKYRPQFTPVVIHHPTKDGPMAGAYNLLAGVDVALHAEVPVDTPGIGTVRFEKNKDGEKTTVCTYRWLASGSSAVLVPAFGPGRPGEAPEEDRRRREYRG